MSHVALQTTKPGQPLFVDLQCLEQAANMKGLEIVHTNEYNWYGKHMRDYPLPPGKSAEEIGHDALFILRVKEPLRSQLHEKYHKHPYDIGIVEDKNNPGCYSLVYDFFNGGYGIDELVGEPVYGSKSHEPTMLCPELKIAYDLACVVKTANEVGDHAECLTMKQASERYPEMFPASTDEKTWVSIVRTEERIGVA